MLARFGGSGLPAPANEPGTRVAAEVATALRRVSHAMAAVRARLHKLQGMAGLRPGLSDGGGAEWPAVAQLPAGGLLAATSAPAVPDCPGLGSTPTSMRSRAGASWRSSGVASADGDAPGGARTRFRGLVRRVGTLRKAHLLQRKDVTDSGEAGSAVDYLG
jgi:hypothetical protein